MLATHKRPPLANPGANSEETTCKQKRGRARTDTVAKYAMDAYATGLAQARRLSKWIRERKVYSVLRRGYIIYTTLFVMNCGQSEHPVVSLHCATQRTSKSALSPRHSVGTNKPKLEPSTETKNTHEFRVTPRDPQR